MYRTAGEQQGSRLGTRRGRRGVLLVVVASLLLAGCYRPVAVDPIHVDDPVTDSKVVIVDLDGIPTWSVDRMVLEHTSRDIDSFGTCLGVDGLVTGATVGPQAADGSAPHVIGDDIGISGSIDDPDDFIPCSGLGWLRSIQLKHEPGPWFWEIEDPAALLCWNLPCASAARIYIFASSWGSEGPAYVENMVLHVWWGENNTRSIELQAAS